MPNLKLNPPSWHNLIRWTLLILLAARQLGGQAALPVQAAAVHYARPAGLTTGSCDSWANACELQYALVQVAAAGDEIWVEQGVHRPTFRIDTTFPLKNGVSLYGGFAGTETTRGQRNIIANVTVLSGDIEGDDITDANGVVTDTANVRGNNVGHVVTGIGVDATAILDGFTITGGETSSDNGGGMYNYGGSPTLTNITFSANFSTNGGGGMINHANSNPLLINVIFRANSASSGGGMYNEVSSPTLMNVTFINNFADGYSGGGMYSYSSNPTLTNVTFVNNSAVYGGGMYIHSSNPTLTNVTFVNNSASTEGSGMANANSSVVTVRNTLFVKGTAGANCSGDAFAASSTNNLADDSSCGSSTTQSTSINLGLPGYYGGNTPTVPLLRGSAAIDAGNAAYCPATDQRGFKRVGQCDIGAYEMPLWSFVPLVLKNYEAFFEGPAEVEDNNACASANGPLRFGRDYTGIFDDEKDFFSVRLPAAGTFTVAVTRPAGGTVLPLQLQLRYQTCDNRVAWQTGNDTQGRQVIYSGAAGWYYIYLNAGYLPAYPNESYTLRVMYP